MSLNQSGSLSVGEPNSPPYTPGFEKTYKNIDTKMPYCVGGSNCQTPPKDGISFTHTFILLLFCPQLKSSVTSPHFHPAILWNSSQRPSLPNLYLINAIYLQNI